ncbi:FkbM family methyltransferase [Stieleria varia]|uniref:2-O-methyltransferase NoeI n=1 Tax=Stieleria varia TaxID=2528005 RepID=A0A5C6B635_9BACT|nr:FkbM family methyltransferase [Stieleria varia]TWU05964.1 2-O-methyltransferase NoeI [Stieleria varia]
MLRPLKNLTLSLLRKCGWELSRRVSVEERRKLEYEKQLISCWRCLQIYNADLILDVGANEGQFAMLARQLMPETPIVSFEPLESCYTELKSNQDNLKPFEAFHTALGDSPSTTFINRCASTPSSSLLEMGELHKQELPHTASAEQEQITVSVLDNIVAERDWKGQYILKIDVQGYEEQVLLGAKNTLARTLAVVVEISAKPLYLGEPGFDKIYSLMKSHGFEYAGNIDQWRSQKDGRILQFDCLFENTELMLGRSQN